MGKVRVQSSDYLSESVQYTPRLDHPSGTDTGVRAGRSAGSERRGTAPEASDPLRAVVRLAQWLPDAERALVTAVYEDGGSIGRVAHLTGRDPSEIRRALAQLIDRVSTPAYAFVVVNRSRWPAARARVGTACWLEGRSVRGAAQSLGLSIYEVRIHREAIRALIEDALKAAEEQPEDEDAASS